MDSADEKGRAARAAPPELEPAHTNMTDDTTGGHQKHQVSEEARLPLPDPRTKLYAGGFSSLGARGASAGRRLRVVVRAWLEELRRVGLSGKEKTAGEVDYPPGYRDGSSVRSVQLENGETVWLRFGAYPEKHGFLQTEVLETPPRTDRAILAILSVLEGGEADLSNIRDALTPRWDSEREEWVYGRLDYAEERLIECADELLLHYRSDLRELPQAEQRVLRAEACGRVAAVAREVRKLHNFLEFGEPGEYKRNAGGDAWKDVYAAELHHVAGMTPRQITEELGLPRSDRDRDKGDYRNAGERIKRGTALLVQGWGQDEWERQKRLPPDQYGQSLRNNSPPNQ